MLRILKSYGSAPKKLIEILNKHKKWALAAALVVLPGTIPAFALYKLFQHVKRKNRANEFDHKAFLKNLREELKTGYKKDGSD